MYDGAIGFTTITTRIIDKSIVLPQYLCNFLNSQACKAQIATMTISDRSNLNQSSYERIVVTIPQIEHQHKINEMLEKMDTLIADSTAGLPAEIEARRKQYEHYRDKLLDFQKQ